MNQLQKRLVFNIIYVTVITVVFVFLLTNLKDVINQRESLIAMKSIGQQVLEYKKLHGSLPSEETVETMRARAEGSARLSNINYRAPYISIDSEPNAILAYNQKTYNFLLVRSGYVVLFLNGEVKFIKPGIFNEMLSHQQGEIERRELQNAARNKRDF